MKYEICNIGVISLCTVPTRCSQKAMHYDIYALWQHVLWEVLLYDYFPSAACMTEPPQLACVDIRYCTWEEWLVKAEHSRQVFQTKWPHCKQNWLGMQNSRASNHQKTNLWYVLHAGSQLLMTDRHPDVTIPVLITWVCNKGHHPHTCHQVTTFIS